MHIRLLLALVIALAVVPSGAQAITVGGAPITRGAFGYGTVHVTDPSPPPDCTSPQSTSASTESDCASFEGTDYDTCTTSTFEGGSTESCSITLAAQVPSGWSFDHWSGDCSGTTSSCELVTYTHDCDTSGLHPVCTSDYAGPESAIAHFTDTRAPTTHFNQAPGANTVVYSDSQSQQFTFSTDEDSEAPHFACSRDSGGYSSCASGFTWSSISDGTHTFCARATDPSNLQGASACTYWEQETNPTATILNKPAATTSTGDAAFTYTSNKAGRTDGSTLAYKCSIDSVTLSDCPTAGESYSGLADGSHTFRVEAVFHGPLDGGGVTHTSGVASYTWTQSTPPPPDPTPPGGTTSTPPSNNASSTTPTTGGNSVAQTTAGNTPAAPVACVVPNLKGMKLGAAKRALARAHCKVGKVKKKNAGARNRGKVLGQGVKPGKSKAAGATVALTVGR